MVQLKKVLFTDNLSPLSSLASAICVDHYTPLLGGDQAHYMAIHFHSEAIIREAIDNKTIFYVVRYSGKEVGYFAYKINDGNIFVDKMYLMSEFRGLAIGCFCMNFMECKAQEFDCSSISLKVEQNNVASIKTFEKWGFVVTESLSRPIGGGFVLNGHVMIKDLSGNGEPMIV